MHLNGCWNRKPLVDSYGKYGLDRKTGQIRYFEVKNVMSKECQYTKRLPDVKCEGCHWRKDEP
jgi:hypothetical protein